MSFSKGVSQGAQGAVAGSSFGPIGAAIGGGLGFLGGIFTGGDTPDLPDFQYSKESLASPDFQDINIKSQNPEMYAQLMQNQQLLHDMQSHLSQLREGPTASEQQQYHDYMAQQAAGQAGSGTAGSPMGNAMMADSAARLQNAQRDRAFQEYTQMQGQVAGQSNQNINQMYNAQNQVMGQQNANRQASMMRDEYMRQQQMGNYAQAQQAASAQNGFVGGLINAGTGILGHQNDMMNFGAMTGHPYDPNMAISNFFGGGGQTPVAQAKPQSSFNGAGSLTYGQNQYPWGSWGNP